MKFNAHSPIELLAPAGSPEALDAAIAEGADSVYLGLKDFNARIRAKNFSYHQLEALTEKMHALHKKVYLTLNTVIEQREIDQIYNLLLFLKNIEIDAVIVQDMGLIDMINQFIPGLKIHASTQMNAASSRAVNFLSKFPVRRVILSRELDLDQIKKIRMKTNAELEIFIHGALCVSVSGLCLFSSYFGGKSANRGRCTQACRRLYQTESAKSGYFFSPRDLMLLEMVPQIIDSGIDSLKIEGRMKSYQYIAATVRAYRYMIDHYQDNRPQTIQNALAILKNDMGRPKTHYLFVDQNNKDFITPKNSGESGVYLGKLKKCWEKEELFYGTLDLPPGDGQLKLNDLVRFHSPDDLKRESQKIKNIEYLDQQVSINIPPGFKEQTSVYLIQHNNRVRKYPRIIPQRLTDYKKHPGIKKAPLAKIESNTQLKLPADYYIKINDSRYIYILQSLKPKKIIFHLNQSCFGHLMQTVNNTDFKLDDFIIYLEPDFYETDQKWLEAEIEKLTDNGIQTFIINNLAHFQLLKNKKVQLIAGPYLYTFNSLAVNFAFQNGCQYIVSPIENSKKNLLSLTEKIDRRHWLITVFSFPELFQIRSPITKIYDFKTFIDNLQNYEFYLINSGSKASILPEKAFSIIDKIPYLKKKGFNKFIIDLAFVELKKSYYKKMFKFVEEGKVINDTTRFNWKNGFFKE